MCNNQYSGITTVLDGILQLGTITTPNALPTMTVINSPGILDVVSSQGLYGITCPISGTGTVNVSNNISGTTSLRGVISGTISLNKSGAGFLELKAANTYTGTTTISGGILQIGNGTVGSIK